MVKTGDPYLKSGESIILTTDRVRVNTVQYDVLLTTRHLILVDATRSRFQPKMYPLLSIQSVKGGRTANGELVISLFFDETANEVPGPMVLVFSQQPGEQRKSERDEWIKKLMRLIVSERQERNNTVSPTADDQKTGIMPSMRRTFAPEMSLPYKTALDTRPAHAEMVIIPDEPEIIPAVPTIDEIQIRSDEINPSPDTLQSPVQENEISLSGSEPVTLSTDAPQSTIKVNNITPGASEQVSLSPDKPEPPTQDAEELPGASEQVSLSPNKPEPPAQDAEELPGAFEQVSLSPNKPEPPAQDAEELPGAFELVVEITETITPSDVQDAGAQAAARYEDAGSMRIPGTSTTEEIPPDNVKEEKSSELSSLPPQPAGASFTDFPEERAESVAIKTSKVRNAEQLLPQTEEATSPPPDAPPLPPATGSKKGTVIGITAILILVLLLAAIGLNFSANQAPPVEETTLLPTQAVQQTTAVPTQITIPQTGIWTRVEYSGKFYGWMGIPGSLRGVNSSGSVVYRLPDTAETIQVNMYKTDNSGNPLSVEVFRDGRILTNRTVSVPMGFIELLIDTKTGYPPGITPQVTQPANQTGSQGGRIMYF